MKPREKLIQLGVQTLSDQELIQIIISSGSQKNTVQTISTQVQKLLIQNQKPTLQELKEIPGIGDTKACIILSALHLKKRITSYQHKKKCLNTSSDIFNQYKHIFDNPLQEECYVLLLDTKLRPITIKHLFTGTMDNMTIHAREIFHASVSHRAHSIVLMHNHPSQIAQPSEADKHVTKKMEMIGDIIGIPLVDHIIFTEREFYSFAKKNEL